MLIQNMVLYQDRNFIRVNRETDSLFYFFDYDSRDADTNTQFQHFHPFYEICIMLCPTSTHFWEGKPFLLQALDIFVIPPNVLHKVQYPAGESCRRIAIQFHLPEHPAGLSDEYRQLLSIFQGGPPVFRFEPEVQQVIFRSLNEIFLMTDRKDPMRNLNIHGKFIEFLTALYLNQDKNIYANRPDVPDIEDKIYSVANYIHNHYAEELTLDFLAQKFFISSFYLSRQFKSVTGFTLTDYIQMTRIRNVQALLVNTETPIAEAASSCGFFSFSQFNRTFRKHIGMSPSAYRKMRKLVQEVP